MHNHTARMIDIASDYAYNNNGAGGAKIAAVLTNRTYVLAVGYNQYKSHPLQAKYACNKHSIYLHAEIDAIRKFVNMYDASGLGNASMYIARVWKDGTPALAKPCVGCQRAISAFDIPFIHWTGE